MDAKDAALGIGGALVVIAGGLAFVALTGGFLGGDDDPRTVEDLDDSDLPDGVTTDGLADAGALSAAHNDSLAGRSYVMTLSVERTVGGGTARVVQTSRVGGDGTFLASFAREGDREFERAVWGNDSVALTRLAIGGGVRLGRTDPAQVRRNLSGHVPLSELLAAGDYAVEDVTTRDGETAVVLAANGTSETGAAELGGARAISNYSGTAVVGESGVVYELTLEMELTDPRGRSVAATFEFAVEGVGDTGVDRPEWVSEAVGRTGAGIRPGPTPH